MESPLWTFAISVGCVGTGLALAWRRPKHRPIAALLALGLAVDVALELALPFAARVALGTCYPWAAWAVAKGVLRERDAGGILPGRPRPRDRRTPAPLLILLAFALFVTAILASGVRGPALARCYAAAQIVVALGCGLAVWGWKAKRLGGSTSPSLFFRSPGLRARPPGYSNGGGESGGYASRPLSATTACAIVVAFVEMAQPPAYLLLPSWTSGRSVYAFGFVVALVVQAAALTRERA